jgi:hypothetical protein
MGTEMQQTFRIQRTGQTDLQLRGILRAASVGPSYVLQIIQVPQGSAPLFAVVIGDYSDDYMQVVVWHPSIHSVLSWLRGFESGNPSHTVAVLCRRAATLHRSVPKTRQELLEIADDVLRGLGGHAPRPQIFQNRLDFRQS